MALQLGMFVAVVSGQVALARRARPISAVTVGMLAIAAMVGVASATLRWSGLNGLPAEFVRNILLAAAGFCGIVVLATTGTALWLARRDPLPRSTAHWTATALAGVLIYPLAIRATPVNAVDVVSATDDGTRGPAVWHPPPQERLARALLLPACVIPDSAVEQNPAWRWRRITPVAAQLPMPAGMHEVPDEVPDDPGIQQWEHERWGNIVLELDDDAQKVSGFMIGGGAAAANETQCALRIGSSLVPVTRSAFVVRRRGATGTDSMFTATTDVPFALPDTQLGVSISAHSRAGRDTLLSILAAIRFVDRESDPRAH